MKHIDEFFSFKKKHDEIGTNLLNSLKSELESDSKIIVNKYADYKRSVKFKNKLIEILKNPSYGIAIDNKHYDVSDRILKKIWNLLDNQFTKKDLDSDNLSNHFK